MGSVTSWTSSMDSVLRELRSKGTTWDEIARAMRLSRNTVLERARKIGARQRQAVPQKAVEAADRPARPAGHPLTWGLLTENTPIEGGRYPYPVFL